MRALFAEVRRVLADDGTLWLNIGDSYSSKTKGSGGTAKVTLAGPATGAYFAPRHFVQDVPDKNLMGIPWRVGFALQDDGWTLRNAIVWSKPNAMPESVTDRLSTTYEQVFLFSKSRSYWFDIDPIRQSYSPQSLARYQYEYQQGGGATGAARIKGTGRVIPEGQIEANIKGKNPGDVWTIPTQPFTAAHFAVMPTAIAERCILAGCKPGGVVLDPFSGSGTTGPRGGETRQAVRRHRPEPRLPGPVAADEVGAVGAYRHGRARVSTGPTPTTKRSNEDSCERGALCCRFRFRCCPEVVGDAEVAERGAPRH
jgi:site-specific DNA-methyltransferase (cytosine-N4-specific)